MSAIMNLDKMRAGALTAKKPHKFIPDCDPDTVLEMIAVIDAALQLSPHLEVLAPSSSAHLRRLLKALEMK